MTIAESLSALNAYPIPVARREIICIESGLVSGAEFTAETSLSVDYIKAKAMVFKYLAIAPNVTENGITYSFNESDKKRFLALASELLESVNELKSGSYGYKGEDL